MSRLFQDALKANKDGQIFTGDPQFLGTSEQGNIATTEQTKTVIEQFYSYYSSPITYQQIATNGANGNAMVFDSVGNLYLAICNYFDGDYTTTSYVYKITPNGSFSTFASVTTYGGTSTKLLVDSLDNIYWAVANFYNGTSYILTNYIYKITPAGTLTTFASVSGTGCNGNSIIFDSEGNLFWAMTNLGNASIYNQTSYVYKISPYGVVTTFASVATTGGFGTDLQFDSSGNLYWAVHNWTNGSIFNLTSYVYKITPAGSMTTFCSVATNGAADARLQFDTSGNLYWAVANNYNGTSYNLISYIYKITPDGSLTTFASKSSIGAYHNDMIFDEFGNLYWCTGNNYSGSSYLFTTFLTKITPSGQVLEFDTKNTQGVRGVSLIFDTNKNLYWSVDNYYNGTTNSLNSFIYRFNKLTAN